MVTVNERRFERRDSAAGWASGNPVLNAGEWGYDTTKKAPKIGDGTTAWDDLPHVEFALPTEEPRFYVSAGSLADDANTGTSPRDPFATLAAAQAAIAAAIPSPDEGGADLYFGLGTFEGEIELHSRVRYVGIGVDGTIITPPDDSTSPGCITIDPNYPCVYTQVKHLTVQGNGVSGQHGIYIEGLEDSSPGSGLWWSSFEDLKVTGFLGHQIWLRGGGTSNMLPNQFLKFTGVRAFANTSHYALMMSGQCGQIEFDGTCEFDGPGKGDGTINVALTRECSDDFGVTNISDIAPYSVTFDLLTSQNNTLALWVDRASSGINVNGFHVEQCTNGALVENSAEVTFTNPRIATTGDGVGGYGICSGLASVVYVNGGAAPEATTSFTTVNGGIIKCRDLSPIDVDYNGSGGTLQVSVPGSPYVLETFGVKTLLVNGDAGAFPIYAIKSPAAPGEMHHLLAFGDDFALGSGFGITLGAETSPLTIPEGSCATLVRFDLGGPWVLVSVV